MRPSRTVPLIVTLALVAPALVPPAEARPRAKERVVELRYEHPDPMVEGVGGVCAALCGGPSAKKGERYLVVEAVDDVSLFVPITVYQDFSGDGIPDRRNVACLGRGDVLELRTRPYARIGAYPDLVPFGYRYPDDNRVCPGAPTSGIIRLTFSTQVPRE